MTPFKDTLGREWKLAWTFGGLAAVRSALDIDLFKIDEDLPLQLRLRTDIELFVNSLFVLLEDQAKAAGVSDEDFGRGLDGDTIENAEGAFWAEAVRFFRGHRRQQLQRAIELQGDLEANAIEAIEQSLSPEARKPILRDAAAAFRRELNNSAGN